MPSLNKRQIALILIFIIAAIVAVAALITFKNKPTTTPPKFTADLKKGIYKCPTNISFCQNGKNIIKGTNYEGFGGEVATGSAILASFDGLATGTTITLPDQFKDEKLNVIYLDNKENNIRATYYFKGESINFNNIPVKMGTNFGKTGDKMLYFNTFLLFSITKGDIQKGEKVMLSPKDFID